MKSAAERTLQAVRNIAPCFGCPTRRAPEGRVRPQVAPLLRAAFRRAAHRNPVAGGTVEACGSIHAGRPRADRGGWNGRVGKCPVAVKSKSLSNRRPSRRTNPPTHKILTHRLVQEALNNAVRHSGTRNAEAAAEYSAKAVAVLRGIPELIFFAVSKESSLSDIPSPRSANTDCPLETRYRPPHLYRWVHNSADAAQRGNAHKVKRKT